MQPVGEEDDNLEQVVVNLQMEVKNLVKEVRRLKEITKRLNETNSFLVGSIKSLGESVIQNRCGSRVISFDLTSGLEFLAQHDTHTDPYIIVNKVHNPRRYIKVIKSGFYKIDLYTNGTGVYHGWLECKGKRLLSVYPSSYQGGSRVVRLERNEEIKFTHYKNNSFPGQLVSDMNGHSNVCFTFLG